MDSPIQGGAGPKGNQSFAAENSQKQAVLAEKEITPAYDVERLKTLLAEETEGPWTYDGPSDNVIVWGAKIDTRVCFMTSDGSGEKNAALIVAAVNALPALLARIAELEEALEKIADEANDAAMEAGLGHPRATPCDLRVQKVCIGLEKLARATLERTAGKGVGNG